MRARLLPKQCLMHGRSLVFTGLLGVCLVSNADAVSFVAPIDESQWDLEESRFYCKLSQPIPSFGAGTFVHEAGERAVFELVPTQKGSFSGSIRLVAAASPWQPGSAPKAIGNIPVTINDRKVVADERYAGEMLASLYGGMFPTFRIPNWLGSSQSVNVALSSVNFQKTYLDYAKCVDNLLPVNYRQVARTAVLYPPAQWRLSDATKDRLDLIVEYLKEDDKVRSVFVDGHSDNAGRRLLNRDLSKQRAEEVTRYLVAQGISEDLITTRFHGERYPVVPNNTADNRARNRRTTIRLERD
jgi:outer membrane protein OmpA-like peptidoglycan-associated protein